MKPYKLVVISSTQFGNRQSVACSTAKTQTNISEDFSMANRLFDSWNRKFHILLRSIGTGSKTGSIYADYIDVGDVAIVTDVDDEICWFIRCWLQFWSTGSPTSTSILLFDVDHPYFCDQHHLSRRHLDRPWNPEKYR